MMPMTPAPRDDDTAATLMTLMTNGETEAPPRTLVYTHAFGKDSYLDLAEEMCRSLARIGFSGDVRVVTDRERRFTGARAIRVSDPCRGRRQPCFYQTAIRRHCDLSQYDLVIRSDSDVIWLKSPDLFFPYAQHSLACTQRGRSDGLMDTPYCAHQTAYLSRDDLLRLKESRFPAFNAGTLCMPGKIAAWFLELYERRWETLSRDRWENRDESVFSHMLVRGEIHCSLLPRKLVTFPLMKGNNHPEFCTSLHGDTIAVHLVAAGGRDGPSKADLLQIMRAANGTPLGELPAWYAKLGRDYFD